MPTELTNHRWLMLQVVQSETLDDLQQAAVDIECDIFEREPWTLDPVKLSQLRHRWCQRKRELDSEA